MISKVQVVGASMSTFTRTIRMALEYVKVPYEQISAFPHSEEIKQYNAFGKLPALLIPGRPKPMVETLVMRTFIDATYGNDKTRLTPLDLESQLNVNFWISSVSDHVFKNLIFGVAKPREMMEKRNESEEAIQERLSKSMPLALRTLAHLNDEYMNSEGPYLCGDQITWADLYLYPCMADMFSLPETQQFKQVAPKIWIWYQHFEQLDLAKNTYSGSVAQQRASL
ncbi:uncharacterized protein BX664DRAFT_327749 [Halteromyces radiatus]|uniref:uncharacterized protein n=1 Tax=Halteromyces radiatus TaxID=101107 RepID=UPI002220E4F5|nr:uncharacterized protein BX664DRAFT_327749 [Halteromyces radiatus]KAI8092628.1 hypothetical protein BX664DRAFT_327749 [Halteromyces radiatus]